jgi:hypothetical protein
MNHLKKSSALLLLSVLIHTSLMADERKDAWYVTTTGESSVMESIYGSMYATLYEAADGNPNVYFEVHSPEHCRMNGERTMDHNPISINGTFVQISQHCNGEWNLFFPFTDEGRAYVRNQFKISRSVTLESDGYTLIFSAIGFNEHYNKINRNLNAL